MAECELWRGTPPVPGTTVAEARRSEDEGWDGLAFNDSQCVACDPFVEMALASAVTERIKFATAVTNPVTRHVAVLAATAATLQVESAGRVVVGLGRGDSALAHLGLAPASPAWLESYLVGLQGLLRGEEVPFSEVAGVASAGSLGLGERPSGSRLRWLERFGVAKVPVEVAASGPRVLGIAGRLADRVMLAVGVDVGRVRWAMGVVDAARAEAGLVGGVGFGVNVPVFVHPDRAVARRAIAGVVTATARFSAMAGPAVSAPADVAALPATYDMNQHGSATSPQAAALTDEVIDAFAIAGPAGYCAERLLELRELGVEKLHLRLGGVGLDAGDIEAARRRLVDDVLPKIR
ncbi:MAG: Luciferase-like, subgroup [Acidimicrobiales bacterium]|nr:Luciferase-like, subgroup [Acidimicrobiales bacterium]